MKLKYLGTAATEGIPAPFCNCKICAEARVLRGRELRSRSQALVNDKLLIDFNADTFMHSWLHGFDLYKVRHCIITHIHSDHFYPDDLRNLYPGFVEWDDGTPPFRLYGSADLKPLLEPVFESARENLEFVELTAFETVKILDMTVTPLKASHGTKNPFIYIIEQGGKTMLYGNDTGNFPQATWDYLDATKPRFDLISLDCTEGAFEEIDYNEHMCLGLNKKVRDEMCAHGFVDGNTVTVLQHFSHSGKDVLYRDMVPAAEKEGMLISYDGMEIEF